MSVESEIPFSHLTSIELFVLGNEENIRDSHVNVVSQDLFRKDKPHPGGIYDAHMGTTDLSWKCETCFHRKTYCPGHSGVIHLNYPVPSPLFLKDLAKWLKVICFNCGKLLISYQKLPVSPKNILGEYVKIMRAKPKNIQCVHCKSIHPNVVKDRTDNVKIFAEWYDDDKKLVKRTVLYPHKMAEIFDKISDETVKELGKPTICHPRKLILNALRAPPNTIRPDMKKMGGGNSKNNDVTVLLQAVIKLNDNIPSVIPKIIDENLEDQINLLSLAVFELIKGSSSTSTKLNIGTSNQKGQLVSIAKRIPRKPGRVRRNLMGRRVNYMARSFITCDPSFKIDEVGVPFSVARNIQIPEIVQEYNRKELEIYFMNGLDRYPGCTKVKKASTGKTHWLGRVQETFRLEVGDVIYRDLVTGDVADFNRQPSLLVSNISAMTVRVMEGINTITMNILSCQFFNADFKHHWSQQLPASEVVWKYFRR